MRGSRKVGLLVVMMCLMLGASTYAYATDTTRPTMPIIRLTNDWVWSNTPGTVTETNPPTDASGIAKKEYRWGTDGTWQTYTSANIPTPTTEGFWRLYLRITDGADNTNTGSSITLNQRTVETNLEGLSTWSDNGASTLIRDTSTYHSGAASAKVTNTGISGSAGTIDANVVIDNTAITNTYGVWAKYTKDKQINVNIWNRESGIYI